MGHRRDGPLHRPGLAAAERRTAELLSLGYEGDKPPWDAFWGQRYAIVRDPDGNTVDLFSPR
jgi:uncharacterized glyoxalase superfamily protein PhnB